MGFDYLKFMTPEMRARVEWKRQAHERDVAQARNLSNDELCEKLEYYLSNCDFPYRHQPGEPVYDGVVAHVIIPELVRRIKKK